MSPKFCSNCGDPLKEQSKFCTNCGKPVINDRPAQPIVESTRIDTSVPPPKTRKPMSKRAKFIYATVASAVVVTFLFVFVSHISDQPHPIIEEQQTVAMASMYTDQTFEQVPITSRIENRKILIPLNLVLEKKIVAFDYEAATVTIPLLAYISNEGKIVTSFRFCEPCNSKNFKIEAMEMVCGNCTTRWKLNNLRGISGNCQKYPPSPIPSQVVGAEIQIDENLVANWKLRI